MTGELHLADGELDAFVDGELATEDVTRVESHVLGCASCRTELEELRWLQSELRSSDAREPHGAPEFEARLRRALDREDADRAQTHTRRQPPLRRWTTAGLAAVAAAAALAVWVSLPDGVELPSEAAARTLAASDGAREPIDPSVLEARFAAARLPFAARVLDLRMLGWQVASGALEPVFGRASAQIVYRDGAGRTLLCLMLAADVSELPGDGVRFVEGGIAFSSFARGDVTVVAWAEGDVLCLLAAALPADEVRALAVAKAMLPASAPAPS